jgi:hypothetical protein
MLCAIRRRSPLGQLRRTSEASSCFFRVCHSKLTPALSDHMAQMIRYISQQIQSMAHELGPLEGVRLWGHYIYHYLSTFSRILFSLENDPSRTQDIPCVYLNKFV